MPSSVGGQEDCKIKGGSMQGIIIMWDGGKGIIAADNRQFNFNIDLWQGNVAPKPNMRVLLSTENNALSGVSGFVRRNRTPR
jgi:hypothetical protein